MNPTITKLIAQYLAGELSPEDRAAFEQRMETSELLRNEVALQQQIQKASKRAYQREQIQNIGKSYHWKRNLGRGGLTLLIAGIIAAATLFAVNYIGQRNIPEITEEVRTVLNSKAQFDGLDAQYFIIPESGGTVISEQGVLISVPKNAFLIDGKPYEGVVTLQFQEALKGSDILKSGLSTMSGDQLLETGGMVSVAGYTIEGKALEFNPKVGVYVQVPSKDNNPNMQLYDGQKRADGSIDWVNPVDLEKIPVPVPMAQLNFYPKGYETHLNSIKWRKSKASRDSLYLSLEEDAFSKEWKSGKQLFEAKCANCHNPTADGTAPALAGVRSRWHANGASDKDLIQWVRNWQVAATNNAYAATRVKLKPTAMKSFGDQLSDEEILSIFDYLGEVPVSASKSKITPAERDYLYGDNRPINRNMTDYELFQLAGWAEGPRFEELFAEYSQRIEAEYGQGDYLPVWETAASDAAVETPCTYILPSKVLGFWNDKFNNTNLATHDFERRMQTIHGTCNNQVLDVYVNQLDRSLYECDMEVVKMGFTEFEQFASEHIGKMSGNNPHLAQLKAFYSTAVSTLQKRNSILQSEKKKKQKAWDTSVSSTRTKELERRRYRETQAYQEEFDFNLKHVEAQLGKTRGFTIRSGSSSSSPGIAVKNIDAMVAEATRNGQSTTITDPETGKKAEIVYNSFDFDVANSENYLKLYAYVMPYELNSYQRIDGTNGHFSHPLNNAMRYNVAIVGVKEDGYGYFEIQNFRVDEITTVTLKHVSEVKLNASVEQLNRIRNGAPMRITEELSWLVKEQADYKEQKMRKDMAAFRNQLRSIVFPCCSYTERAQQESIVVASYPN